MHQAGQPALPGVGQVHREKVSLHTTVGCGAPEAAYCLARNFTKRALSARRPWGAAAR